MKSLASELGLTLCWSMANAQPPLFFMLQSPSWQQPSSSSVTLRAGPLHCTVSPLFLDTDCKRTITWYCQFHTGFHIFHSLFYILLVYLCLKLKLTHNLFFNCNALFETRRKWFYMIVEALFSSIRLRSSVKVFWVSSIMFVNELNQSRSNNWSLITESSND